VLASILSDLVIAINVWLPALPLKNTFDGVSTREMAVLSILYPLSIKLSPATLLGLRESVIAF
jgi:hypothetical protein